MVCYIVVAIVGYLLGSIPTGFLVAKARGVDIRAVGSGNIGAANTFRAVGRSAGIFVLVIDAMKGFAAAEMCYLLVPLFGITDPGQAIHYRVVAGIFAVLGHNYTCWLNFKGGKGIATTAGVYLALVPLSVGLGLAAFIIAVVLTRYTSVGSMFGAIVLTLTVCLTQHDLTLRIVTIALCILALLKHRTNLQRLLAGTENRIEFGKRQVPKPGG
ncbi:MAG TPA: glycerol-3-phosphate 1-O-acyltransferase PlsY [Verrucomicrobiae bacterium]|nr:glycerol-3-phosphate 1-O-acyltransferase PlsY [Verrucomicrobiae bacterium]